MTKFSKDKKEFWLTDIAKNFFNNINWKDEEDFIRVFCDVVSEQKTLNFDYPDDYRDYIRKIIGNVWGPSGQKNINNIFKLDEPKIPERKTIIKIAFALNLDEKACNKLLKAAKKLELHNGGDKAETAIYYCLKYEKIRDFNNVKKILDKLDEKITEFTPTNSVQIAEIHSQRTIYNRKGSDKAEKKFDLSMMSSDDLIDRLAEIMLEQSPSYTTESSRFSSFWTNIYGKTNIYKKNKSKISKAIFRHHKDVGITADEFFSFYEGLLEKEFQSIKNAFSTFAHKHKKRPSREFVCLLLFYVYYKEDYQSKITLSSYIDENLELLGLDMLHETLNFDRIICEMSKFKYSYKEDQTICITYHNGNSSFDIQYNKSDLEEHSVLNSVCLVLNKYQEALKEIYNDYLFTDFEVKNTYHFLETF